MYWLLKLFIYLDSICLADCSVGMMQCPESNVCVNNTVICDGNMDCPYGRDETVEVCGKYIAQSHV